MAANEDRSNRTRDKHPRSRRSPRKAPLGKPAFQPYWGKLAVRNDRGIEEMSASFEARSAPRSYPTKAVTSGAELPLRKKQCSFRC